MMAGATVLAAVTALVLTACAAAPGDEPETAGGDETAAEAVDFKGCMVSDFGRFDDKSLNQSGLEGMTRAAAELGIEEQHVESASDADYLPNVEGLLSQDCDLIIGVGSDLEDAIQTAAEANPDLHFALIDSAFSDAANNFAPVEYDNAKPLLFNTQEAAFLAGYVAAGVTQTGTVATFGGLPYPSVTIVMDAFVDGVATYNEDNGAGVRVLGWEKGNVGTGTFAGNFDEQDDGYTIGKQFIEQGADVIMPVAGPVGLGTAAIAAEVGNVKIIGDGADWYETAPDYSAVILTSVIKQIGTSVFDVLSAAVDGSFSSEPYVGTLANGGVDLAPFHDLESAVPAELQAKVEEYRKALIDGTLTVESSSSS